MKFCMLLLPLPIVTAFAPSATFNNNVRSTTTTLQLAARVDATKAIEEALAATKTYGATSPEARVAWTIVEEMSDSEKTQKPYGSLDTECAIDEEQVSQACMEYSGKLEVLQELLKENQPKINYLKSLAEELQGIKLTVAKSQPAAPSPELQEALKIAKETEKKFGQGSPESKVAWAEMEEIASSGLKNAMGKRLDEECLLDQAVEACKALDELNTALAVQTVRVHTAAQEL